MGRPLDFEALLSTKDFEAGIKRIENQIKGITNTTQQETSKIDGYFKNLSAGIGAYFSANMLQGFVQQLINVRGEFQKTEIAFGTMLQSKEKAKELMEQMVDLAAKTPFGLQEVSDGAKRLLAFQVPANEVVETLRRMGDVAAGLGVPMGQLIHVYGQVKAQGKLMTNDLYQFMNAGIPILAELGKVLGKSEAEIKKMVGEGKIGFTEIQQVIQNMTNEGGLFFNLMEQQSGSLSGKIANLGDAFDQMLNKIGESNEGILYSGIEGLTTLVENYEEVLEILVALTASYGAYKAAVITTATANQWAKQTVQSEIAMLSISEKMKLGRALVTQRQAEASLREAQAERVAIMEKYKALQVDVQGLAVKKQKAVALATERMQMYQTAQVQLSLAKAELASLGQSATMRQRNIAIKNVEKAQNQVLATQEQAEIARKNALATSTQFYTAKKNLENTATAVGIASKKVENAQEAVSVATKNASAIATARLTIAQRIQTIATNLGAKAQAFLNATILANPYALATAAIVALGYGIYKFASQIDTATELQDSLNKKINEGKDGVAEKTAKLDSLIERIKSENTTNEEKKGLLSQINQLTDGKLGKIDLEMVKTGQLQSKIKDYIGTLYEQAEAMAYVSELQELYKKKMQNERRQEDIKKNGVSMGEAWDDFWDKDTYKGSKVSDWLTNSNEDWANRRLANENKAIDEQIQFLKKKTQEKADVIAKAEKDLEVTASNATENKKGKGSPKELAEVYSKDSIKDLEQRISLWNNALERADSDGNVRVRAKDKYGKEYETKTIIPLKEALEKRNELEKVLEEKRSALQKKSFDEELAEIQRQVNLRDKYLQAGYSKESMDNLFPKVKDKTYLGYLNDTRDSLKKLLDTGKGNQETAQQLDRVNTAIDEFTAKKSYIEGLQQTIENLTTKFSGQELIDKLKKIKNLNANETEQENREKANLIDKAIEQEEQKMKQAYARFLQEHKTYNERKLEIEKRYAQLKAQAETDAEAKKIEKAEAKEKSELELDFFKESGDWGLAFSNLEYLGQSTIERLIQSLEEFKKAKAETLQPTELKELNAVIENLRAKANRNPLKGLVDGFKEFSSSKKKIKQAQGEYNDALDKFGKNSDEAKEKQKELTEAELESAKARQKILDGLNKTQEIFNAIGDGMMSIADAFGGLDDASKDAVEDIMAIGNAALDLGKSITSGDVAGMIKAGIQLIGNIFKALSGDKKKERSIKRQTQALKDLENAYKNLEHAAKKAIGAQKYDGQKDLIKNLEQQKIALQGMINTENSKKKKDQGKIKEWQEQIQGINRSIDDLKTDIITDILQTDLAGAAEKVGDALVDAFSRGEYAAKSLENAANDMIKSILKNQLNLALQGKLRPIMDDFLKQLGFDKNGNGSFRLPTQQERQEFKNQIVQAGKQMQGFLEATKDIFQGDGLETDSLKGAIKGMSEDTAGVLAGQFNAIRINTGELVKNSAFSLEAMKNAVGHLVKIEQNTFNLHQMRKDLAELNSKISSGNNLRAAGL